MGDASKNQQQVFKEKTMIQNKGEGLSRGIGRWKKPRYRSILIATLAFWIALVVGIALVLATNKARKAEHRRDVIELAASAADGLWHQLSHSLSATFALASIIRQKGKIDDFPALAEDMINSYGGIGNLQLQPKGIVKQIYPLAGNEKAIGHNLLQDPKRRTEALAAIESKKLTLAGPITLIQGGVAVIGRLPVFVPEGSGEDPFWGFTAVLIHLDDLLETAHLDRFITGRYVYELSRINPDTGKNEVFACSDAGHGRIGEAHILDPVQHLIEVPNGEWILSITPIGGWGKGSPLKVGIALVVVASGTLAWMVYSQLKKSQILANEIELRSREITQRQQAEEALKESENKYRSLFESAPMGIGLTTSDGRILALNETFIQMSGYSPEEAKEINVRSSYDKPEDRDVLLRQLELDGFVRDFETVLRRKDGSLYDASLTIKKLPLSGQNAILTVASDITSRKRALAKLKESEEQLRNLYARLQSAREEERLNISRDVHDNLGQMLTALKMDLIWLKKRFPKGQKSLVEKAQSMTQLFDATIQTVRKICMELRPTLLEDFGIAAAIESQIEEFEARTGIKCQATMEPDEMILDNECGIVLFRILQETLTNITRHANATQAQITVQIINDHVILVVEDNGKGISESQISDSKSFGLLGMRERAYSAGGKFEICGRPNAGTTIKVSIPLNT